MTAPAAANGTVTFAARLSARLLWQLMQHVSDDDSRPALHVIYIDKSGWACATNGHSLLVASNIGEPRETLPKLPESIFLDIPKGEARRHLRNCAKSDSVVNLTLTETESDLGIRRTLMAAFVLKKKVYDVELPYHNPRERGPFPDACTVIREAVVKRESLAPASRNPRTVCINPALLGKFAAIDDDLTMGVQFYTTGPTTPTLLVFPKETRLLGIAMPMRLPDTFEGPADVFGWAKQLRMTRR